MQEVSYGDCMLSGGGATDSVGLLPGRWITGGRRRGEEEEKEEADGNSCVLSSMAFRVSS